MAYNIVVIISSKLYYRSRNAQRDKIWDSMSEAERAQYLVTTTDKGNKRCVTALNLVVPMPDADKELKDLISASFTRIPSVMELETVRMLEVSRLFATVRSLCPTICMVCRVETERRFESCAR